MLRNTAGRKRGENMDIEEEERCFRKDEKFQKCRKAATEILEIMVNNELTAAECRSTLRIAKKLLKHRPVEKDFPEKVKEVKDRDFYLVTCL